jgi:methyl-accepting chemotaxis protein
MPRLRLKFRLGLAAKIFAVGGIAVFGLMVVAAVYFYGETAQARYHKISEEATAISAVMDKISVRLLEMQRAEKDFLLTDDDRYVKRHGDLAMQAGEAVGNLKRMLEGSQYAELTTSADDIRTGYGAYTRSFLALVEAKRQVGLNPDFGLQGSLRKSVHDIEKSLTDFDEPQLTVGMLTMRRHEKDFILRHDAKYGAELKKSAAAFASTLDKSLLPAAAKENIGRQLAAYVKDFAAYMEATQAVIDGQKKVADAFAKMEPQIQAVDQLLEGANTEARTEADAFRGRTALIMQITLLAIFLAGGLSAFLLARNVTRPIVALRTPMQEFARGNLELTVPGLNRTDEVGDMARELAATIDRLKETIGSVIESTREVTNASLDITSSTTDLSQRTEEQAASLEQTSASMEEITVTVRKNAENAKHANELATSTRTVADRGGEVVASAVDAMAKISQSSSKISDIIVVIDEIARQTNLLALNAAVEAARAGEAGRGFAVVATEVRSLAQRSAQAAKDIKELIVSSGAQVEEGVRLVNQAGSSLNEIVKSITEVAGVVADIANASMEQSTGIEEVNRALTQMDEVTQQNSALVEENAATAKTLEEQARMLDEQMAFFRQHGEDSQPEPAHPAEQPVEEPVQTQRPQRSTFAPKMPFVPRHVEEAAVA